MAAHGVYAPVLKYDYFVGVHDGADALGDDYFRHAAELGEGGAYLRLGRRVHGGGRVVEDEDLRLFQQGAGYAQALLLPAGDVHAALAEVRVQPAGQALYELICAGGAAGCHERLVVGRGVAPLQVLAHGAGEEYVFLQHHGHGVPQGGQVVVPHVPPADEDAALRRVVEPRDELDEGALGGTRAAQDAHRLARGDVQLHARERVLRRLGPVLEADALEVHAPVRHLRERFGRGGQLRLLLQHLAYAPRARQGARQHEEDAGYHHDGVHHLQDVAQKARELADQQLGACYHPPAEPHDAHDGDVHRRLQRGQVQHGAAEGAAARLHEGGVDGAELLLLVFPAHEGLDGADGREVLLHDGVELIHRPLEQGVTRRHAAHDEKEDAGQHRRADDEHQRQSRVHHERETHAHAEHDRAAHQGTQAAVHGILQDGHVRRHAGDEGGGQEVVYVLKGVALHGVEDVVPEVFAQTAGGRGAGQAGEGAEEQRERRHEHQQAADT